MQEFLPTIPEFKEIREVDVKYPLIPPFASAHIFWDDNAKELVYHIIEPPLDEKERQILMLVTETLVEALEVEISMLQKQEVEELITEAVKRILKEYNLKVDKDTLSKLMYYIFRNSVGFNELEPLMRDPYIEDISCDGVNIPIFIVHKKFGNLRTNLVFKDAKKLQDFVIKLAQRTGRYISYAEPLLDGTLPDGSRVQATFSKDVTTRGPTFTIRKFPEKPLSIISLLKNNTLNSEILAYLWLAIQYRRNILITGGTGSGKTTLLNAICVFIPRASKVVSVEDTRELTLPHQNWTPAVARSGFGPPDISGKRYGEVTLFDLLKESFRQRPDYVVVGEVRGAEAFVLFQGAASGHPSLGTIHAGSVEEVVRRLQGPPINLPSTFIKLLDIVVVMSFAKIIGENVRRVKEVSEIASVDPRTGEVTERKVFIWDPTTDTFKASPESVVLRRISEETGFTMEKLLEELNLRKKVLEWLKSKDIEEYSQVAKYIEMYEKSRKELLQLMGA
ncbi:MAG: type II/IV secretion system ATPase subunit [Candidatus Nanoarchaeia archaeon]|nr:type II/IV secretion system ATPase subunit [Candidatus Haiyanarchaeum thermophilum]MCW1303358.1 type II/IV secretion system ATPase subunit [Candidatus Haiyanarchaeum thermophilum]MCW1303954.1 type II/IV secretion system ATPase subunit [Candidatus Haiyanarchaeum thermophilum]MCW1306719.1 type II/IV secretion system ATPase subunit [Candidatus Haiyanarchaeum thermophilum]MCW1307558.1 type II/IV secretion system ATPase subunit [Candidatus Haiyanarchaeum thermophilum]